MALRESTFSPALQNSPVNLYNQRSPYSPYYTRYNSGTTPVYQTPLLAPDIAPNITPQWPKQFTDMAFFMSLAKRAVRDLEYNWVEEPWIHYPLGVRTNTSLVAPSANTVVQQTIPIPDATIPFVRPGDKVMYSVGGQGIVASIVTTPGSGSITVNSMEGKGLPAVTTADTLMNHGPITGDGYSTVNSTTMPEVVIYNNWLEQSGRYAQRWDPVQKKVYELQGTTDYLQRSIESTYMRLMTTLQARLLMSTQDRSLMPDGSSYVTTTSGLLEQQANAGVTVQTVSASQAVDAIRQVIFDTSLTAGGTKVLLGTREKLQLIGQQQKADKVRYTPENTTWNMDIYQYEFHGHQTIEVPMDQWKDVSLYGPNQQNEILILNKEDLVINYLEGWPMISRKHTLLNENNGDPTNMYNFDLVWYETMFGFQMNRAFATGRLRVV